MPNIMPNSLMLPSGAIGNLLLLRHDFAKS